MSWVSIAEGIADTVAWFIQSETSKHLIPHPPIGDPIINAEMLKTTVILMAIFGYLSLGCLYQLLIYWGRVFWRTKVVMALNGSFCFSAFLILVLRIYNFWYDDLQSTIYAYYILTGVIVAYAVLMTIFEYQAKKEPTKREFTTLANIVREVVKKHGLDKQD